VVPRDERIAGGSQARLAPTWNIQGRLGLKRRMEREEKERNANPNTEAYGSRNRQGEDGSRLGSKEGTGSMLPVRKKGTLSKRVWGGAENQNTGVGKGSGGVKRKRRAVGSCLPSSNEYSVLSTRIMQNDLKLNTEGAREVRRTLRPLREVWMKVGLEKLDTHEGVTVKALLDSGAMGIFMDKDFAEEQGFKLVKLEKPVEVKNMDGTDNNRGRIEHEIECNMYFEGHVERIRVDVCKLGRTKVILGMPWLAAHNLEIDWEKEEVKMTRCPP